jgi:DNA primase
MPRIPDADIDRIKRETDLAALVRSRGVEMHKHGAKDFAGKCPFHQDDQPSFIVSPEKGLFHCMGCGAAGNAIQFVEKFDGVSFRHAFELLNAGPAAFSAPGPAGTVLKNASIPRLELPFDPAAEDAAILRQVVDYYHERLLATPAALDYLASRGLRHAEALERFRLGFADRTLGLRIPDANRKAGAEIRTRLQTLGLIRESGHEHFNGSVVMPIFTEGGELGELYGRKIRDDLRPGTPYHLYLPGPHEGIWNAEALDESELILCEAPFDALTFWVNGFKNVTFIYGTEGFPDYLFDALLARRVRRVRIAYDADDAGNRAAARDAIRLTAHGVEVFRVKFPWGMDANEYAQKVQPPAKALQTLLNAAEWIGGKAVAPRGAVAPTRAPTSSESLAALLAADEKKAASESSASSAPPRETFPFERLGPSTGSTSLTTGLLRAGEYHVLRLGPREYRVGGLDKNNGLDVLKVTVRLKHGEEFHLDSFDMARDGDRRRFIERAAEETKLEKELVKRDLGKLLLAMEQAQEARIHAALAQPAGRAAPGMTAAEREEALAFLKAPDLVEKIGAAFDACGLVGEDTNRLAAYLACTSRKLGRPLAVIVQSTSAAGKSTLMEAVLSMFPEEERVQYSAMTGQSLYYLGETDLKHKILAIVEEEGAEKASYALKLLQSEGQLTIASTGKDPTTGRMETQEYHVEGPVMIFLTTTAIDIDEELQNRCLTLTVDESREQTERIHALQRKARTLDGLVAREGKKDLLRVLRNAQRLLQPLAVVNDYAERLTFVSERTRTRRDHEKYLSLIDAVTLLHQHQRPVETRQVNGRGVPYIRATLDDIALANRLAPEILGRSLDELPPQTRRLLSHVKALVRAHCKQRSVEQPLALFSRRDLSALSGWSYSQIKRHLSRLQEQDCIAPRFGRMGATLKYELLIDADDPAEVAHIGLLDVARLRESGSLPRRSSDVSRHSPGGTTAEGAETGTTTTRTGGGGGWTPPCQNPMAGLSPATAETSENLATLPARKSGARRRAVVS